MGPNLMARKRKLPQVPWAFFLWTAFVLNIWIGLHHSHVTNLRIVRVVGVPAADQGAVNQYLQQLSGTPGLKVNRASVESQMLDLPDIRFARFESNAFGDGRLELQPYQPVVAIKGTDYGLTPSGVVLARGAGLAPLPSLSLPPGSLQPISGLSQPLPLTLEIQATLSLKQYWPDPQAQIQVNEDGTFAAVASNGPEVDFGTIADYQKKYAVLSQIYNQHPEYFKPGIILNLVDPSHPTERNRIQLKRG